MLRSGSVKSSDARCIVYVYGWGTLSGAVGLLRMKLRTFADRGRLQMLEVAELMMNVRTKGDETCIRVI